MLSQSGPVWSHGESVSVQPASCLQFAHTTSTALLPGKMRAAATGNLVAIMGSASAARAVLRRIAIPTLPSSWQCGQHVRRRFLGLGPGDTPKQGFHGAEHPGVMYLCIVQRCAWRHGSEEMVAPGTCTLQENLPTTLKVGDPRDGVPEFLLFLQPQVADFADKLL